MKAFILHNTPIKNDWLVEVKDLIPDLNITLRETDILLPTIHNPYFDQVWGDFTWLRRFTPPADIRCFATSVAKLNAAGITAHWGMYDLADNVPSYDFYFGMPQALDKRAKANGFKSNFAHAFVHEFLHGEEKRTGRRDRVHAMEAKGQLKQLLELHLTQRAATRRGILDAIMETLRQRLIAIILGKQGNQTIYQLALDHLGVDASPADLVDDVVGCAETVTTILAKRISVPIIPGTWTLWQHMEQSPQFRRVDIPMPGCVIISPTGTGNGKINGHVGIVGKNDTIMSNDSFTGKWMANFTTDTWTARYVKKGGMPIYYYNVI